MVLVVISEDGEREYIPADEVMPPCDADEAYWRYGIE